MYVINFANVQVFFLSKLICTTEIIGIIGIHPNSPNSSTPGSQVMKALNEKRAKRDHLKEQALTTGFENSGKQCFKQLKSKLPPNSNGDQKNHQGISCGYHPLFQLRFLGVNRWMSRVLSQNLAVKTAQQTAVFCFNQDVFADVVTGDLRCNRMMAGLVKTTLDNSRNVVALDASIWQVV